MHKFNTKDLNFAAFLWTIPEVKMKGTKAERVGGATIYFAFELPMTEEEFNSLQLRYFNGEEKVEPGSFCNRQNQLRDMLHQALSMNKQYGREAQSK